MKAVLLALCILPAAAAMPALAQSTKSDPPPVDFKPLISPILPPLLLPNSYISPGSLSGDPATPYSANPSYDNTRSAPAPGLRLTIPTR